MLRFVASSVVAALLVAATPAPASEVEESAARATLQQTVDQVLAVLRNSALSQEQRRSQIEEIAYARFDLDTMSRLVLARRWRLFDESQRTDYIEQFKTYLANNYGDRINRYDQEEVEITGERSEARGDVTVKTRIVGGEFSDAVVHYRLRQKDGEWRVIDVIIEGISMVSNFRDQFKAVMGNGGPELLIQKLREKNASGGSFEEESSG